MKKVHLVDFILNIFKVAIGMFRPSLTSEKRYIFNYLHRGLGLFVFLLASTILINFFC